MGGGTKVKRVPKVLHPNSRKAGQVIKRLAHTQRVSEQKRLREKKETGLRQQIRWFQTQVESLVRPPCTHRLDELIMLYLARNDADVEHLEAEKDFPYRKLSTNVVKADQLRDTIKKETDAYNTGGIEIPDISGAKGLLAVQGWESEVIDLVKVPFKRFNKKQLTSTAVGPLCQNCSVPSQMDSSG